MSIVLHIERLVIDAAALGGERSADVRAAIERELARRLAQSGATDTLRCIGCVDALPARSAPAGGRKPEQLGVRVAGAVAQGLGLGAPGRRPT